MKNKKINYILLFLFTALVLFFALKDNFNIVMHYILDMNIWWLLYALLLVFGYWFFKSLILKIYINNYKKDFRFIDSFKLQMETMFFNAITPFSSGGQPFQVLSMKKHGIRMSDGTNIIVMTSFVHQFSLFLLAIFAVIYNLIFKIMGTSTIKNLCLFGFLINILFMAFLLLLCFSKKTKRFVIKFVIKVLNFLKIIKNKEEVIDKWEDKINSLDQGAKLLMENKKGFIISTIYNIIALISMFLVPMALMYGMGINVLTGIKVLVITTYVDLIGMFIPIPGGTGGLEYAFLVLFGNFVNSNVIKSLMLVWRFVTYYFGMIIGSIVLNLDKGSKELS